MSKNISLTGSYTEDFTKVLSIEGISTALALKEFRIENAIWDKMVIDSLMPLLDTNIEKFMFCEKAILENDYSFLTRLPSLKQFDFSTNILTTEQVALIVANFLKLDGFALKAKRNCELYDSVMKKVLGALNVGKIKPSLIIQENEKQIEKYIHNFEI